MLECEEGIEVIEVHVCRGKRYCCLIEVLLAVLYTHLALDDSIYFRLLVKLHDQLLLRITVTI